MPRPLKEILAELRELITGEYTIDSLAADMQSQQASGWPELYQQIFNAGHKKATGQNGSEIRAIEKKLEEEQNTNATLRAQIKKLEEKAPDAATLRQEYETREANLRKDFEGQLAAARGEALSEKRKTRSQKLIDALEKLDVRKEFAQREARDYEDRFDFDDKNQPIVLQIGQRIPYSGSEDEAINALARDIRKNVPEWALGTTMKDRGAGNRNEGPSGGGAPPEELRDKKIRTGDYAL
jgi:isoleucyl-tRNA synthetase